MAEHYAEADHHAPADESEDEWEAPVRLSGEAHDNAPRAAEVNFDTLQGEEKELAGDQVPVIFHLPNGELFQRNYVLGQDVSYLKAQLEDLKGLEYGRTTLRIGGKVMLDPLSLSDIPLIKPRMENHIEVIYS